MRLFLALAAAAAAAAAPSPTALSSYRFDSKSSFERRAGSCPDHLLQALRELDGRPDYTTREPSGAERRIVGRVLSGLPARMRLMLSRRLVGVFLVEGFATNGLTTFAEDEQGRIYPFIVLNPAGFSRTLSDTLTARERSAFEGKTDVRFKWGEASGAEYSLVHEAAHAYDYVSRVTPCVERRHAAIVDRGGGNCLETPWEAWRTAKEVDDLDALPDRERLRFYGLNGRPPGLRAEKAPVMLAALETSPFASLYGATSRADDAAELITFYHLTRTLGKPPVIVAGGREYRPMKGLALERAARIYRELEGFPPATSERK